ncbi:hypothetical protein CDL12_29146 [Handroanthus impetiginosus]|uniref:Uncharacterized protein n=1 Tax=Handroanthus impetiginosus TaxID=429701 RepID=A0A2G9FZ85_9LAMI|nr:hypothetical protein CDL12_29146 [Handroanthus impetiginosus]
MAAALGVKDSPFMRMGSLDGLGDFRGRLSNVGLSPFTTGGMLGRLNSPANVNLHNLTPSALVQPNQAQNLSNAIGKMHLIGQNASLFQGISSSLDLDPLQHNKGISTNFNDIDNSRMFTTASTFSDPGAAIGSSSNILSSTLNNTMMLNGNGTHNMASFNSESFNAGVSGSTNLLDPGKCNENWQITIDTSKMQPNSLLSTESFQGQLPLNGSRDNTSSNGPFLHNNTIDLSSGTAVTFEDWREMRCHGGLVGDVQNMNRRWGDQRQNYAHGSSNAFGSLNSHIPANSRILNQNTEIVNGGSSGSASTLMLHNESGKLATESRVRSNEEFLSEQSKLQGGFVPQSYDSLDELVNAMIKREQDETTSNCDFEFHNYSFGSGS